MAASAAASTTTATRPTLCAQPVRRRRRRTTRRRRERRRGGEAEEKRRRREEERGGERRCLIARATGRNELDGGGESTLQRIVQLTGFSDPIYAEAVVTVHQYDIVLDVTLVNQTSDTLQNVCIELATLGDLKLVERPQYLTIGALDKQTLRAAIKATPSLFFFFFFFFFFFLFFFFFFSVDASSGVVDGDGRHLRLVAVRHCRRRVGGRSQLLGARRHSH